MSAFLGPRACRTLRVAQTVVDGEAIYDARVVRKAEDAIRQEDAVADHCHIRCVGFPDHRREDVDRTVL
ncbi:hypothetical protein CJ179_32655 [Rhodococcus sp. ACS1]|uniref:hypothetical protein n=1 Tax=Rhodococcus koreensis TaxID=99653 RepID=UPI0009337F1E|nr:hypothetical protein [Rhodococcus koreensis]PBC39908.1 hypothetical protein CJ179_32655 [Rhodococcus sp. ACS1]QSE77858.1 hypothetical protein JWS14_01045 [Rhodococcus koreensis]